jgi:gas vesicle protein
MNNAGRFLLGIGACIAAGAALGILFAPDEGVRTRGKIFKGSRKLTNSVGEAIGQGKESLAEIKDVLERELERVNRSIDRIGVV